MSERAPQQEANSEVKTIRFVDHHSPEYLRNISDDINYLTSRITDPSKTDRLADELLVINESNAAFLAYRVAAYDIVISRYLAEFSRKPEAQEQALAHVAKIKTALAAAKLVCEGQGIDIDGLKEKYFDLYRR